MYARVNVVYVCMCVRVCVCVYMCVKVGVCVTRVSLCLNVLVHAASNATTIEKVIAFLDGQTLGESGLFGVGEKFDDRGFPLAVLDFDEREAFRPCLLGELGEGFDLPCRDFCEAFCVDRLDDSAAVERPSTAHILPGVYPCAPTFRVVVGFQVCGGLGVWLLANLPRGFVQTPP